MRAIKKYTNTVKINQSENSPIDPLFLIDSRFYGKIIFSMNPLVETITSEDEALRNRSINSLLKGKGRDELLNLAFELEAFRKETQNLYHRVRASLFLHVIYRFYLQENDSVSRCGSIPVDGFNAFENGEHDRSIDIYLRHIQDNQDYNGAIFSAIAEAYHKTAFRYLLNQVKISISHCRENYHLFHISGLDDYPYSTPPGLTTPDPATGNYPVGFDASPVRLDPSHSGWSDIFFLGMDFPEGARVVNISVDLKIHGSDTDILPPCECYCRYIEKPIIRLVSIDLKAMKEIASVDELFNFGSDHLSLLKAGIVASGIVPPCFENKDIPLSAILEKLLRRSGGIEIVTRVNNIPKGSRLAVSTTLLATIITRLMRFSGQIKTLEGGLSEEERRIVASRAILGEWLGGSGGGWQDSGGLWPGIKVISGRLAKEGDPEWCISRGCLLPEHDIFERHELPHDIEDRIVNSMVLVHGGISMDVGPILEMVTEKYLLKYEDEWKARLRGVELFDMIVDALKRGDMRELGRLTTIDWEESIQKVIPWVNNAFTDELIMTMQKEFGEDYWGFLMLGGMSGGGMAFIVNPEKNRLFKERVLEVMHDLKKKYRYSYPFIIDPVVYDFRINQNGIMAGLKTGKDAMMPEVKVFDDTVTLSSNNETEEEIKKRFGFDHESHEYLKKLLKNGEITLEKNRLSSEMIIEDVAPEDVIHFEDESAQEGIKEKGIEAIRRNEVAVVTFAGGLGSRWTHGSAVVKPLNPFIKIKDRYRTFIEIHLAKSRRTSELSGVDISHVFTTSYLTHDAIVSYMERFNYFNYSGRVYLSPAKSIGKRVYPMKRDIIYYYGVKAKVQKGQLDAVIKWIKQKGEGEDYSENIPILRFNPPGHWYEIPNLIKNGTLGRMLKENPDLKYLLCHNIDTLGASIDPNILGMHIMSGRCLTFEVTPMRVEDRGGGLARVNGHIQLIEGLALPDESYELMLSYYNSLTNWITIDLLLEYFGLDRTVVIKASEDDKAMKKVQEAIRKVEKRIAVYVTLKKVRQLWGSGQEDVYLVAQFERLWGDITHLRDLNIGYVSVSRYRAQQLKETSQLYKWMIDGSYEYLMQRSSF